MFYKKIDLRNKRKMVEFLINHFKYNTLNNWNNCISYSNDMKIYKVIPSQYQDYVFQLLDDNLLYDKIFILIEEWNKEYNYNYQVEFNGRSGGYLVMYIGGIKDSGYKSVCTFCGQRNYKTIKETGHCVCGKCKEEGRINETMMTSYTRPGKSVCSIDSIEEIDEIEIEVLKEEVISVQSFDKLCDKIIECTINQVKEIYSTDYIIN